MRSSLIAGNHDSPRAVETGIILRLFAEIPGVIVVDAKRDGERTQFVAWAALPVVDYRH